ncbi:unnamed protein product, partial [Symbiodinium pilosum]
ALRRSLRPALVSLLPPPDQQQGGTPGSLLAGAHRLVRAHQQLALGLKAPTAALFLDVSSAYYRVLRQSFGQGDLEHDEDIAKLLALLKVPPSTLHEVCDWLSTTDLLTEASPHCTALIRVFLCGTFFHIQGADFLQAVRARIGGLATSDPVLASLELPINRRVCDTGRFMPDVAQHVSAAWAQVRPLARHVLRNPALPFAKRRLILNSLAFSAACSTAATWGPLNGQETRAWRTGYVRLVRLLGRDDRHTGQPSLPAEIDVCKAYRFSSPLAYLRAERILHAARLLLTQSTLWDLLRAAYRLLPESWLHVLREDLEWLVSICPQAGPSLCDFPDGFAEQALHAPSALRTAVRKAKADVLHSGHEPLWQNYSPADGLPIDGNFQCEQCPAAFATAQQLS